MKTRFDMLVFKQFLLTVVSGLFFGAYHTSLHAVSAEFPPGAIAAQLEGVQHGSYDGRDYLTLTLSNQREVGPLDCRSNLLRLNVGQDPNRRGEIEAIALSAMLSSDLVMIVLPTDGDQCYEGRPAFTDIYPVPPSL